MKIYVVLYTPLRIKNKFVLSCKANSLIICCCVVQVGTAGDWCNNSDINLV